MSNTSLIEDPVNIWVIEDEKNFRKTLSQLLNSTDGFCCQRVFESFEESVPAFEAERLPRIVLIDIELPGVNGIEAIRQIKAMHPELLLVVLTISENRTTVLNAICAGASGYLIKTDSFDEILNGIQLVQRGGSPLSGEVASMVLDVVKEAFPSDGGVELTEREVEVLTMLADGSIRKEVASQLSLAPTTVDFHLRSIYQKLQVNSHAGAVAAAIRKGLI